jgi:hypothetical protein
MVGFCLVLLAVWWGITLIIALVKWKKYRKENATLTKEQKNNIKQANKEIKYRKSAEYKEKYLSEVEIENSYFGKGILLKNSEYSENTCYTDIKSGFDKMFTSFGNGSDTPYDLYEFLVKADNINYVLDSLEKIYKNSKNIMEKCYVEIYNKIVEFFENSFEDTSTLKKDFCLDYLKENWYVHGVQIYDDLVQFHIGIDAAANHEDDSNYEIIVGIGYNTQEAEVMFNASW